MGHVIGKNIYRKLGRKIDNLPTRTPWNETFHAILKELYSMQEADLLVKMPYGLSSFDRVRRITGYESAGLMKILEDMCAKGLIIDLWVQNEYYYAPSPFIIGVFEMTMMRAAGNLEIKTLAKLFYEYIEDKDTFYKANCGDGQKVTLMRTLPHEETINTTGHIEILDYEKALAIVERSDKFSIGLCSCRQEKMLLNKKICDTPLETCSSFGRSADYQIRHNFAREVSKSEMLANLQRSKEIGLVLNGDNVQNNVSFICHCCKCCCKPLLGISKLGYPNVIVTSSFISYTDEDLCNGCGQCADACPVNAIKMISVNGTESKKKKIKKTDTSACLGCGVCALKCKTKALSLKKRGQRIIHPETTFERIILQCLEHGTLQNQLFDNPQSISQKFMRGFVGGVLKLSPVKKALMSDMLRSSFLHSLKNGVKKQGKGWMLEM